MKAPALSSVIALIVVVLSLAYAFMITFLPVPKENVSFANTIMGILIGGLLVSVVGFYFGSSDKSRPQQPADARTTTTTTTPLVDADKLEQANGTTTG